MGCGAEDEQGRYSLARRECGEVMAVLAFRSWNCDYGCVLKGVCWDGLVLLGHGRGCETDCKNEFRENGEAQEMA